MRKIFPGFVPLALLLLVSIGMRPAAFAQSAGTASIQGTISDSTGAVIPNATVTLTNTETSTARTTVSDGSGVYSIPNFPVGPYLLNITASGFRGFTQRGVLEVGNNLQANATLSVGNAGDQIVEVQATGAALETEASSFKQVIDQQRITELPLNGRQATQLILVSGGAVNAPSNDMVGSKNYFSSVAIAVAGSQGNYNNYVLDGGTNTDTFTNVNLPYPFPDALREFSVESNSLPARNGIHPGSLVNVVTNSGTNQFHGTVFDFIRNNVINANNFFSPAKDTLKRNQFGGTLGGKILTDRLFFFGGYQGTRNNQVGNATSYCIPTAAEQAGDFSQMGGQCAPAKINTGTSSSGATTYSPLINPANGALINTDPSKPNYRKLDPSTYSAPSLALLKYFPYSQADQYGHLNVALPANYKEDQYIGRVDYTLSQKHSLFVRFFLANYNQPAYYSPTNILLTTTAGNDERVMNFTLGDTLIFSPKMVNTFHGSYARRRDNRGPAGGINAQTIGINMFDYVPNDLRIAVTSNFNVGCGTCSPGHFNTQTEDFSDDIDYLRGKHQIAFGAEIIRTGDNTNAGYLQNGNFSFNGQLSGAQNKNSGEPLIDYLTGQQNSFQQSRAQPTNYRETIFSLYAQDTYHLTPRITINGGLRWEPLFFPTDKFGRGSTFDINAFNAGQHSTVFTNAPAGSFFNGDAGVPKSFANNRLANFSPRLGVSIDPFGTGKTVFRAGGAIMYDTPGLYAVQRTLSNPPFVNEIDQTGQISFASPYANYPGGNPFPGTYPPDKNAIFHPNSLWVVYPRNIHSPTVYQWTASVQQELGQGWNFSLSYLGNENAHLWLGLGLNPGVYIPGNSTGTTPSATNCGGMVTGLPAAGKPCSNTGNTNGRTVFALKDPTNGQYYSPTMTQVYDSATSNYQGVIAAVQHRMSHNFSFLANYTWSHCISTGDAPGDVTLPSFQDPNNPRGDRANCGFDVRHIFNTTLVASSHFKGLPRYAGLLANNWEIAPLFRILSGIPLNVTSGTDNSLNGQNLDRPNLISPSTAYTRTKITQTNAGNLNYLSPSAFTMNAIGTFGNLGRNAFRQPNYYDVDASVTRTFPLYERLALNIRLEAFNVLNHPNFNVFTTTLNSSKFGYATGAQDPRIFQAAAKFTF